MVSFKESPMSFKDWYMDIYWKFDNIFLISAKLFNITYHEFVLISLCIVWPLITLSLCLWIGYLQGCLRTSQRLLQAQDQSQFSVDSQGKH